jgi:hypothetical protein
MAESATKYTGTCFCGAVEVTCSGAPASQGYCHCRSCRSWSAGPVNAFTLWAPESVVISKGEEHVNTYNGGPVSFRKWWVEWERRAFMTLRIHALRGSKDAPSELVYVPRTFETHYAIGF